MAELDVEALKRQLGKKDLELAGKWPDDWPLMLEMSAGQWRSIIAALEDRDRLREAAQEVWDSVPASYEPDDPMVKRHAAALIALGAALESRDG